MNVNDQNIPVKIHFFVYNLINSEEFRLWDHIESLEKLQGLSICKNLN